MSSAANSAKGFESHSDVNMVEVSREFFYEGMTLPSDVFLRITPGVYLKIGKRTDKAAFSQLQVYKNPQLGVYVKDTDYTFFIQHITLLTGKVIEQKTVPDAVKMKFLSGLAADSISDLEKSNFASAAKVQKVAQMLTQMAQSMNGFNDILAVLQNLPETDSKHSMMTCLVGMMLCDEMNINLPLAQEKVAMGALLHDIGLRSVPKAILDKPKHLLTPEEQQIYEQHPIKGVEMLRDVKDIPSDVLLIVVEHHENSNGTGFPKKVRDVKISPLGKIVGIANYFAELIHNQKAGSKNLTADEAIAFMEDIIGQPFNKQIFIALKNIVNKQYLEKKA